MIAKNILISGADSQVAKELQFFTSESNHLHFHYFNKYEWDICDKQKTRELFSHYQPFIVINTAAYTAVDKAETEKDVCFKINAEGVKNIAEEALVTGSIVIHISTDYVFHSLHNKSLLSENVSKNPKGVYARSKSVGEDFLTHLLTQHIIIRTSWLYSRFGNNFIKTILRLSQEKTQLQIVSDQTGSPTYAFDLAKALFEIIKVLAVNPSDPKNFGIFHYSNEGLCSWYELAKEVVEICNLPVTLQAISTEEFNAPAPRPPFSGLDCNKVKAIYKVETPLWKDSLRRCLSILTEN